MTEAPEPLPSDFVLPALPPALDAWFALTSDWRDDSELIVDGVIADGLGVEDPATARQALVGYRWVRDGDRWVDAAAEGEWDERWIVLDAVNADPFIADLSTPEVRILTAVHGEGSWSPEVVAESLDAFLESVDRNDDVPGPPVGPPLFTWSVRLESLGERPLQTTVALQGWPMFPRLSRQEQLALRDRLPFTVIDRLTETVARNAVEWARSQGFDVVALPMTDPALIGPIALEGLFEEDDDDPYREAPSTAELVTEVEAELGFRLPRAWVALAAFRNGGRLARTAFPTSVPTGWADDHVAVTGLSAIGRTARYSLLGDLGGTFMRDEWGYPDWGVGIANTPTAGHEQIMLDYRACGPQGEPAVVYVDQEADYAVTPLAPDFASFVAGLVDQAVFEDPEGHLAQELARVRTAPLAAGLTALVAAAAPQLPDGERALRAVAEAIVTDKGSFVVHADPRSRLILDAVLLLRTWDAPVLSYSSLLHDDVAGLEVVLFGGGHDAFGTGGYAPGFVEDWWADGVEHGRIGQRDGGWAHSPAAREEVLEALRALT